MQTLLHTHCGTTRDDNTYDNLADNIAYEHSKDVMRRANRIWGDDELKGNAENVHAKRMLNIKTNLVGIVKSMEKPYYHAKFEQSLFTVLYNISW